jgi:Na+/H+-translocating membrane pyrophosphatase
MQCLAGFGFGASSIALFARVAGGIYTKAADVGVRLSACGCPSLHHVSPTHTPP